MPSARRYLEYPQPPPPPPRAMRPQPGQAPEEPTRVPPAPVPGVPSFQAPAQLEQPGAYPGAERGAGGYLPPHMRNRDRVRAPRWLSMPCTPQVG